MHTATTPGRALAIVAGAAFTTGGLVILLGDALMTPAAWTRYHALTILMVFGTIATGGQRRRRRGGVTCNSCNKPSLGITPVPGAFLHRRVV